MTPQSSTKLLHDIEAFCQELRPIEDLAYLEHRYNDKFPELVKKYKLAGIMVPKKYGGRGIDEYTYI